MSLNLQAELLPPFTKVVPSPTDPDVIAELRFHGGVCAVRPEKPAYISERNVPIYLSPVEANVLTLGSAGMTAAKIAATIGQVKTTVDRHRADIHEKLSFYSGKGHDSGPAATRQGLRHGVLQFTEPIPLPSDIHLFDRLEDEFILYTSGVTRGYQPREMAGRDPQLA